MTFRNSEGVAAVAAEIQKDLLDAYERGGVEGMVRGVAASGRSALG
jgi:hypothetical protein